LTILATFVFVCSAVAGRLEKMPMSGAIVAVGFGLVCGPLGLRIFTPHVDGELLRILAELTLSLVLVAQQIGFGAAVGLSLAAAGGWFLKRCAQRDWITETWRQLPVVALAFVCFAAAQELGGSGFIACFIGGLLFGALAKEHKHDLLRAAEGTGDALSLATWISFGAAVVGQVLFKFNWPILVYSLLSLTVVRMLPSCLSLAGSGLKPGSKLFLGWFGPRGLATVVFAIAEGLDA
jgi:NhaP-type Na+/H+ or K+/H+ antiporter